jgi:hypothetical protein
MALGLTQPLTEMTTRNLAGDKRRPARGADNRHLWAYCLENVGASASHNPMDLHGLITQKCLFAYLILSEQTK